MTDNTVVSKPNQVPEQQPVGMIRIQHVWPQLGRALYTLKHEATDADSKLDEDQKYERWHRIQEVIIEQCEKYERQYEAYEFVRGGRAAEIVGNPHYRGKDGREHELPYTGLEGCYAGSEERPGRPGMTREQIIEEEANIGLELMREVKKRSIEHYSWASFVKMQKVAEGETEEADMEDLRSLYLLWTGVVRRLNDRVYENKEYELSPLEQLEAFIRKDPKLTSDEYVQAEYTKLLEEEKKKSEEERKKEEAERRAKEEILSSRLEEYAEFRNQTYASLKDACGRFPHIDYHIEDDTLTDADIIETVCVPTPPDRRRYPAYLVNLKPEQLEGYLFLARLGEIGGEPLTRSDLLIE
jgi:hypothetical protein